MTDVVTHTHADPTPPGDGRRGTRRHRHLGLRVPHSVPDGVPGSAPGHAADTPAHGTPAHGTPAHGTPAHGTPAHGTPAHGTPAPDTDGPARDDDGPRHRRAPGTAPIAVAGAGAGTSRHRAAHRGDAFDPTTGSIPTTGSVLTGPVTDDRTRHATPRAVHGSTVHGSTVHRSAVHRSADPGSAAGATAAASPTATGAGAHQAATPRRTAPLRATIGLLGVGGVAAVFALTTPGAPAPGPAPAEGPPQLAAPAGLATPVPPSPPPQVALSPLPVTPVAPPAVSTTPTTEQTQPVIGALFDAAAGSFSRLFDNSGNEGLVENASRPRIVENPDAPGRQAWQFSLNGGGKRSEVLPQGAGTEPVDGDEQYIRYTAQLSDDFPTDTGSWQVILQWHHTSPDGSPPLALQITRGQLMMVSNGDDMQPIGPVSPGDRIDLTMHVTFSQDPGEGSVTVWRDGRPTGVTGWSPRAGTMSTEAAYLKMGMYRDPGIRQPGSVLVTDLKIGRDARGIGGIGPRPVA